MALLPDEGPGVDFDDLWGLWSKLADIEGQLLEANRTLEITVAEYKREALSNKDYWPNKKPPTTEYLKGVVSVIGNNSDDRIYLNKLVSRVIELESERTKLKGHLDVLHEKVRVWQTMSANARKVLSVE